MNENMEDLINRLDNAESHIKQNNEKCVSNLEKQRLRNKIRKEEMNKMQKDFEENVVTDPEEMNKVRSSNTNSD